MNTPNVEMGDMTPLDVIAEGGFQRVVDLLVALAEGQTS
jgi:hypothetical protein